MCYFLHVDSGHPMVSELIPVSHQQRKMLLGIMYVCIYIYIVYIYMHYIYIYLSLVGGWPTPLKNDGVKVSWEYDSQYMEK